MTAFHRESSSSRLPAGEPAGYFVVVPASADDQAADLSKAASILGKSWKLLLSTTLIAAISAMAISLAMRNVYRAQVLIAPVLQGRDGSAGVLRNQLGGLAALAGIEVGSNGSRKEESIATLSSDSLAREFVAAENMLPELFSDRWDRNGGRWQLGAKQPTLDEAVRKFTKTVRFIREDHATGLVTVAVEWYSPDLAARWANGLVSMVNERLRTEATRNADQSIEYLNKELAKTNVVEIRQAIYRVIEEQVNNAMLANVQREYAFRVIDPAVPPELKFKPARALMVIVGAFIGLLVGVLSALIRHAYRGGGSRHAPAQT